MRDPNSVNPLVVEKLKQGDFQFGCGGSHRGEGSPWCPKERHHHHDDFCRWPTYAEWITAGFDNPFPDIQSRR